PSCRDKKLEGKDLTFMGLIGQVFQTVTSVDSRLLRSLRVLMTRPGAITSAYLDGPRKPYIGPLQLFLLHVVARPHVRAGLECVRANAGSAQAGGRACNARDLRARLRSRSRRQCEVAGDSAGAALYVTAHSAVCRQPSAVRHAFDFRAAPACIR